MNTLFFGAGASVPFGIPTTPTLTEDTVNLLNAKNQPLLERIEQSHNEQWQRKPNYEEILRYLTAYSSPAELRNDDYALGFANRNPQLKNEQAIRTLIDEIRSIVCNYCNQPFIRGTDKYLEPHKLESTFQSTYDAAIGTYLFHEKPVTVFSTNYDPSLEIWCQKRNIDCVDGTEKLSNIEVNKMLNETKHQEQIKERVTDKNYNAIGLVRLHGSIWAYEINENLKVKFNTPSDIRMFSDLYQVTLKKKPCIIFPGQEENVSRGQWDTLYRYYKESLSGNCLFIGFSFRDEALNRPILDRLQNGKIRKLGILSPHPEKAAENLLSGESRFSNNIVTMRGEFGKMDALEQLASKWFWQTEGFGIRGGYYLSNEASDWRRKRETYIT